MQSAHVRVVLVLGMSLAVLPRVVAQTTPYEEIVLIQYGNGIGQLDTTAVHSDDPYSTLVESMQVMSDSSVLILPRKFGDLELLEYDNSGFVALVPFDGLPRDFLVTLDGIYSWAPSARVGVVGHLAFDPGPGQGEVLSVDLLESDGIPPGARGRLQQLSSGPALVALDLQPKVFTINLGAALALSPFSQTDVTWGVPTAQGDIWQDTLYIRRGTEVVLDLGLRGGNLECVLSNGGFVIRRGGTGPELLPTFEIYDWQGSLVRTVVTLPRTETFSVATSPWIFGTNGEVYHLRLGDTGARVLRY